MLKVTGSEKGREKRWAQEMRRPIVKPAESATQAARLCL